MAMYNSMLLTGDEIRPTSLPFRRPFSVQRRQRGRYERQDGITRRVVRSKSTDVLEEIVAIIFRIKEYAKQETSVKQVASRGYYQLGSDMSLRNVG
jgi:hypothetical protein